MVSLRRTGTRLLVPLRIMRQGHQVTASPCKRQIPVRLSDVAVAVNINSTVVDVADVAVCGVHRRKSAHRRLWWSEIVAE